MIEVFSNTAYADMHLAKRNRATVKMRLQECVQNYKLVTSTKNILSYTQDCSANNFQFCVQLHSTFVVVGSKQGYIDEGWHDVSRHDVSRRDGSKEGRFQGVTVFS